MVLATGCDAVLGIEDLAGPPCFRDDFEDGLSASTWEIVPPEAGLPADVSVNAGQVVITAPPNAMAEIAIRRQAVTDLTNGKLDIEVTPSRVSGGLETVIVLEELGNEGTGYAWITQGTVVVPRRFIAGNNVNDSLIALDPDQRFWRIEHDLEAGTIDFSISRNGIDYMGVRRLTGQPAPAAMDLRLQAGVFNNVTDMPGIVKYAGVSTSGNCN